MLTNDTMNALADMLAAEPGLATQVAAIKDPDQGRDLLRRMAIERGIDWQEESLHVLSDGQLDEVSGGATPEELAAMERQEQLRRVETCRAVLYMLPGICDAGFNATDRLGWYQG